MKYRPQDRVYSDAELQIMIEKMDKVSSIFYSQAIQVGNHAFIEFCGLMQEYKNMCQETLKNGGDFTTCNTHAGIALTVQPYQIEYLAEKLDCIYGPILQDETNRKIFFQAMGWRDPIATSAEMRYKDMEPLISKMNGWANFRALMKVAVENASELMELEAKRKK